MSLSFSRRLWLLFLLMAFGLLLAGAVQHLLGMMSDNTVAITRICVVAQDLLAFILPAIIAALLITRLPADFLMINRWPDGRKLMLALLGLCVLFPVVEAINYLCRLIPWGQSVMELEQQAEATIALVAGKHTIPNFIVSILIVGVLTGLAEELFFRGALQQMLLTRPMNLHLAVWLTAIIFSLMHIQPVGFLPRAVLGAYFGYMSVWTGSLWTAVLCHAINNSIALYLLYSV